MGTERGAMLIEILVGLIASAAIVGGVAPMAGRELDRMRARGAAADVTGRST